MKNKKKKSNRDIVAENFKKRTGVTYQNWIQAMSVQKGIEDRRFEIHVPYATETTSQTQKTIRWD